MELELNSIMEKVEFLNGRKSELEIALEEMEHVLEIETKSRSTLDRYDHLQQILNKAVEIRRVVNGLNAKVPDIQEDVRNLMTDLEDKSSLES